MDESGFKEAIDKLKKDSKLSGRVFAVTIITALFALVIAFQAYDAGGRYLVDGRGNVVGIQRESMDSYEEFDLNLLVKKGGKVSERAVRISKQSTEKDDKQSEKEDAELDREAEINGMISDIELSDKRKIMLPSRLSDGSRLLWSIRKQSSGTILVIPLVYICLLALIVKSSLDQGKGDGIKIRKEIMRGLPRFTNQLMLMMNAGMVLSDAFERIAESYRFLGEKQMGYWECMLVKLADDNSDHRISTASVISEFAAQSNVKELVRISTILTENEKRGSDIIGNLSREGRYLWDDRKIVARESGKMIDTKMSYPMGLLLILLIVITMAPALMNM